MPYKRPRTKDLVQIGLSVVAAGLLFSAHFFLIGRIRLPLVEVSPILAGGVLAAIALAGLALYFLWVRYIEGRAVAELGAHRWWYELLVGTGLGACVVTVCAGMYLLINTLAGGLVFNGFGFDIGTLTALLLLYIYVGVVEELVFRGALWRGVEQAAGSLAALVVTGASFGLLHQINPNANLYTTAAIAIEAGLLLGGVYLYTRRLWAVIGIHIIWNWLQGPVFGSAISGSTRTLRIDIPETAILRYEINESTLPEWVSGRLFGLEGSITTVIFTAAVGLTLLYLAHRKGNIKPPIWWSRDTL